jgi:hypothetical protein
MVEAKINPLLGAVTTVDEVVVGGKVVMGVVAVVTDVVVDTVKLVVIVLDVVLEFAVFSPQDGINIKSNASIIITYFIVASDFYVCLTAISLIVIGLGTSE